MNIKEIEDLIKLVSKSGVSEVEIENKDFKITIKTPTKTVDTPSRTGETIAQMPAQIQAVPSVVMHPPVAPLPVVEKTVPAPAEKASDEAKLLTIKSPMIGTFYRSPAPDKPPFVSVGDVISKGKAICIIEAMKLFNEIEAEISGKIVKVLVDNATPVEYDQPLFLVEPA